MLTSLIDLAMLEREAGSPMQEKYKEKSVCMKKLQKVKRKLLNHV